jgi:hypothetical protein
MIAAGAPQHLKTQMHSDPNKQQQAWQATPAAAAAAALQPVLLLLQLHCRHHPGVWLLLQRLRCKCCKK